MKQTALALLLSGISILASASGSGSLPIRDSNDAAARAAEITRDYRLTSLTTECLYFDTDDRGADYQIRVREKHSKECGGDPETSPTVLFLKLRKSDGHATSTLNDAADGNFRALKKPPSS